MNDGQAEQFLERIEVAVTMQKRVLLFDAKRGDQDIDGLSRGLSALAQGAIVRCGLDRQRLAHPLKDGELAKLGDDQRGRLLIANPLENLGQNDRREAQPVLIELRFELIGLGVLEAVDVVDPDRRVDDDHWRLLAGALDPRGTQVAVPGDLAAQAAQPALAAGLDQQPQRFFDDAALGGRLVAGHGLLHQVVIDVDIGPHGDV